MNFQVGDRVRVKSPWPYDNSLAWLANRTGIIMKIYAYDKLEVRIGNETFSRNFNTEIIEHYNGLDVILDLLP